MGKRWKGLILASTILTLVAALVTPASPAKKGKAIKIGASLTLTGPLASTGQPASYGALDYLKYVNEELGGIEYRTPDGKVERVRLDIVWGDNAYSVPRTLSLYKRQKGAGVKMMIMFGSTPGEVVAEWASRDHIPVVGIGAGSSPVNLAAKPNYFTASWAFYTEQMGAILDWIKKNWTKPRPPRVALFYVDVTSVRAQIHENPKLGSYAEEKGIEWLGVTPVPPAVTSSVVELTRLKAKKPDWLITLDVPSQDLVVLKDMKRLGMREEIKFLQIQAAGFDEAMLKLLPGEMEGVYGLAYMALPTEDVPGIKLARKYALKYRNKELSLLRLGGWLSGMVACEGIRRALEQVGYENITGEAINEGIHTITEFDTGGIIPPLTIDPDRPAFAPFGKIGIYRGGKIEPASDWLPPYLKELRMLK